MTVSSWRAPDGWSHRRFAWSVPTEGQVRGSLLFQSGRADFLEKYLEPMAHWHDLGWNLAGFDWRGQGGSGRLLADPSTGHAASLDVLLDDLAAFVAEWRATSPAPHVLIGHSMGGHLVLRLLAEREDVADAAVLVAPMLGLNSHPIPDWAARRIARAACYLGRRERQAWRQGAHPAALAAMQRRLTHCADRHSDSAWWKERQPVLGLGPPSWGWLDAAYASVARLSRPGILESMKVPVLLLGTRQDRLVTEAAIRQAAARLPDARLVMREDAAHELLRETDEIRLPLMAEIDRFLDEKAPRA